MGEGSSDKTNNEKLRLQREALLNSQFPSLTGSPGLFDREPDRRSNIPKENLQYQNALRGFSSERLSNLKIDQNLAPSPMKTQTMYEQPKAIFVHEEELNQCKNDLEQTVSYCFKLFMKLAMPNLLS